jgi:hypothetical protein
MTDPRIIRARDGDRAAAELAREHDALAGMMGADSRRIDALVGDVGQIRGNVEAVRQKVDGVADGVNELRDALTVLVRHDIKMQHTDSEVVSLRKDVSEMGVRVQTIEKQVGPLVETRKGLIVLASAVAVTILLAIVGLVIKQ